MAVSKNSVHIVPRRMYIGSVCRFDLGVWCGGIQASSLR